MKLEDQVCSLELAKKLKELGVKQESLFYWWFVRNDMGDDVFVSDTKPVNGTEYWSAFTVAELGEMLPKYIVHCGFTCELNIIRSSVWRFYYGKEIYLTAGSDDT